MLDCQIFSQETKERTSRGDRQNGEEYFYLGFVFGYHLSTLKRYSEKLKGMSNWRVYCLSRCNGHSASEKCDRLLSYLVYQDWLDSCRSD